MMMAMVIVLVLVIVIVIVIVRGRTYASYACTPPMHALWAVM